MTDFLHPTTRPQVNGESLSQYGIPVLKVVKQIFGELVTEAVFAQVAKYQGLRTDVDNLVLVLVAEVVNAYKEEDQDAQCAESGKIVMCKQVRDRTRQAGQGKIYDDPQDQNNQEAAKKKEELFITYRHRV